MLRLYLRLNVQSTWLQLLLMAVVSVIARFWVQMCLSDALCSIIFVSMVNAAKRSGHRPTNDGLGWTEECIVGMLPNDL